MIEEALFVTVKHYLMVAFTNPPRVTADIAVEVEWHSTEEREKLEKAVSSLVTIGLTEDKRFDKRFLVGASSDLTDLAPLYEKVRVYALLDTLRSRLRLSTIDNLTSVYFNKQAAYMGRIAILDVDDDPPLGSIMLSIISDHLNEIINWLAPPTRDGKILSPEEIKELERTKWKKVSIDEDIVDVEE